MADASSMLYGMIEFRSYIMIVNSVNVDKKCMYCGDCDCVVGHSFQLIDHLHPEILYSMTNVCVLLFRFLLATVKNMIIS